jgi:multimeric flavodoxin WrbA
MTPVSHHLFIVSSTREEGHLGNTEWLARRAAAALPEAATQSWLHLARLVLPPFTDVRHTAGSYPMPEGDLRRLLDATMAASHIVFVSPVYWYSIPAPLKTYIDHWSAWLRVPGLPFKSRDGAQDAVADHDPAGTGQGAADDRFGAAVCAVSWRCAGAARCGARAVHRTRVRNDAEALAAGRGFLEGGSGTR